MAPRILLCALALLILLPARAGATPPTWKAVAVNGDATCAIATDDQLQCWGDTSDSARYPPADLGPVKDIAMGWVHGCAIKADDSVACWYYGGANQMPGDVGPLKTITGSESTDTCGITPDDALRCWPGSGGTADIPGDLGTVKAVDVGDWNSCAIKADDSLACWGAYEVGGPIYVPPDLGPVMKVSTSAF